MFAMTLNYIYIYMISGLAIKIRLMIDSGSDSVPWTCLRIRYPTFLSNYDHNSNIYYNYLISIRPIDDSIFGIFATFGFIFPLGVLMLFFLSWLVAARCCRWRHHSLCAFIFAHLWSDTRLWLLLCNWYFGCIEVIVISINKSFDFLRKA